MGLIFNDQSGKKKIVQDVYKSFVVGDLTPFRKFLDEKTEWISTAPQDLFPHAGRYKGIESILTQIETVSSLYLTRSFLPRVFVEEAEQLAVYLDVSLLHRESGNEMFFDVAHFWTFRSGKIARYVEIFNSAIAQNQQDRSALPKTGSSSES
ncbi:MAG: nuclear transport factor 2 family protein [Rhodobiaceae bacterium]|nr:nuclear transport factor 2 family protein [Rhodobiaceae bacterium]